MVPQKVYNCWSGALILLGISQYCGDVVVPVLRTYLPLGGGYHVRMSTNHSTSSTDQVIFHPTHTQSEYHTQTFFLPPKILNIFLQLGRGHLAQLVFWKFCFLDKYCFGKKVFVVWFRSVTNKTIMDSGNGIYIHTHTFFSYG